MIFSLRSKFIIFIATAIIIFELLFLYFSVNLYNTDKSSYIFETSLNYSNSLSKILGQHIDQLRLISNYGSTVDRDLRFPPSLGILDFEVQGNGTNDLKIDTSKKSRLIPSDEKFTSYLKSTTEDIDIDNNHGILTLKYFRYDHALGTTAVSSDITGIIQSLQTSKVFSLFLFDSKNQLITSIVPGSQKSNPKFIQELTRTKRSEGAYELAIDGTEYIISFSKAPNLLVNVVSSIPKKVAFEASRILIQQTLGLGLVFLGASILAVLIFARMVTKPIIDLTETAEKVSQGDYNQALKKKSNDEIGILTAAFNKMVEDIRKFIISMKEKNRIENEILVAKNVQLSFLPKDDFDNNTIQIAGFYSSATECGGDWWGYKITEDTSYLFISDATGHGLPASLLTASVSSCCEAVIYEMKKTRTTILPADILKMINYVICSSSDQIMATMLIVMVNHRTKELIISNASHEFPITISEDGSIKVLTPTPGKRLGEDGESEFENVVYTYKPGDKIFLYTDGLIENTSKDDRPYGEKNLLRLIKKSNSDVSGLRDLVKKSYSDHIQQKAPEDDVTYLFASLR